jgi:hypothetical protein
MYKLLVKKKCSRIRISDFCDGLNVLRAVTMDNSIFWCVTPCSPAVHRGFRGTFCFQLQGRLYVRRRVRGQASCKLTSHCLFFACCLLSVSSTPKMEAICSSEISNYRIIYRHIQEYSTFRLCSVQ